MSESKCPIDHETGAPVSGDATGVTMPGIPQKELPHPTQGDASFAWWPKHLNVGLLDENPRERNPEEDGFDYKAAFEALDLDQVKKDIAEVLTTSQPWWPADFGNYGPLIIRVAWHSAGTYRQFDGRGGAGTGQQRFLPTEAWPDNVSTDKGRRLLWPVKQKYGRSISWGDLIVLAGNVALEIMGLPTAGYGGGRIDAWEPENVYWGSEPQWKGTEDRITDKQRRDLEKPLGATVMGLIYVDPEGPEGQPDPARAAHDIRETFDRMGMNDRETLALIAGGHTFGKSHGAAPDGEHVHGSPAEAGIQDQGLGWKNDFKSGIGDDTITSGLEVTWTYHPTRWDNEYLHILFSYEWECYKGEGGHWQWRPKDGAGQDMVPLAHSDGRREPRMFTTDLALRVDPEYERIGREFLGDQKLFEQEFAKAWYKLVHRDMGPKSRYLGKEVPAADYIWQDPLPAATGEPVLAADINELKQQILASGLTRQQLVKTAWASASTFRATDYRGGANGARIRLEPQRHWEVNEPEQLDQVLSVYEKIQSDFNEQNAPRHISLADLIVLGGSAAIEQAAHEGGVDIEVPFTPGRVDATQDDTDPETFAYLEPTNDGFRNYLRPGHSLPAENLLIDRAQLLGLRVPELTALIGGLRVLGTGYEGTDLGLLTDRPGVLSNDWYRNLLENGNVWNSTDETQNTFEMRHYGEDEVVWRASRFDLVFSANSELRAVAEYYASDDARDIFVRDFVAAWNKVMNADRYDLR
ncbi:catalase/peroxidase HPI [Pseudoclavibacter sp. CFCC 14310]|uniref:catalase/peroxidase HPI n=1 Tax=Pseudoclavibacter sp. CFCC 14310 TaxID=2615180 RepID=UPI001301687E|nr:catalase/peroxidase HPI [Pseudoclavibacter sp. CFCC 14310]KAB1647300.1 catalase/peroxidase HPI [Pseudoclavibacter sp. CFCC 14310]